MWYIHNRILAIKKNKFESVLVRWIKLEPVIQSEVSLKEKNKHRILAHTWNKKKIILMNLFAEKEWGPRRRESACGHSGGGNGTSGGSIINIYTLSDVKWIAGEKLLCRAGGPV